MSLLTWSSQMVQIALNHLNMVMKLVFGHKDTFGHKDIFGHKDTFGHKDKKGARRLWWTTYSSERPRELKLITWSKMQ